MQAISLYWFDTQQQISTFTHQNMACFTENLVQNLMTLVLASKSNWEWLQIAKIELCLKNVYVRRSRARGQDSRGFFVIQIHFQLRIQNDLDWKPFPY